MTSTEYHLPALPFGGPELSIVRWLKRPGDSIETGDPLLVVVNDRVEVALPAPCDGVFERHLAAEGAAVAAGALVAVIVPAAALPTTDLTSSPAAQAAASAPRPTTGSPRSGRISPVARRIATVEGIDIHILTGSGIAGRILKADVLAALPNQHKESGRQGETEIISSSPPLPFSLCHSTMEAYTLTAIEVDVEQVAAALARQQASFARRGLELTYTTCIALAAVETLSRQPLLNSAWDDERILVWRRIHLALVPSDQAPAILIRDAQDLNARGMARAIGAASAAGATEMAARTFTIVDLGEHVWGDPAALTQGQSAALGVGAVRPRPLVIADGGADRIAVRPAVLLTLAYDARLLDQCHADAFLQDVRRRLEHFHL